MRSITRIIKFALKNALRKKGIALLAIFGIGIGITLQITLDSFSNGISESFDDFFGDMAGNLDIVEPNKQTFQGQIPLTVSNDILSNNDLSEHIVGISPEQHLPPSVNSYGELLGSSFMGETKSLNVIGLDNLNEFTSRDRTLDSLISGSRLFVEGANEVVISNSLFKQNTTLFAIGNDLELQINISDTYPLTIVGITDGSEIFGFGPSSMTIDSYDVYTSMEVTSKVMDEILRPENSFYHFERLGLSSINMSSAKYSSVTIYTDLVDQTEIDLLQENVDLFLTNLYGKELSVISISTFLDSSSEMQAMLAGFLLVISIVTLVAGSMGIIVAQLVGIESRMKEFAILKATGWKNSHIMLDVIGESAALALLGSLLGIILSAGLTTILSASGLLLAIISPTTIVTAILIAIIIGIVGGSYPGIKASRVRPMEVLHSS